MTQSEEDVLREELKAVTQERNTLHAQLTDLRLLKIEGTQKDHEERIRGLETIGTRFNTLYALFIGNGLLSVITLLKVFTEK
jgi:hypothetical protein